MKGCAESDYNLISTKHLSQKIGSSGWGPGPDDLSQKCLYQGWL